MYDPALVQPMREELTRIGFQELTSAAEVEVALADTSNAALIVVNSVCGCSAGSARPGVSMALQSGAALPGKLLTVFAGQDKEATEKARSYFHGYPPSSPSMALLKDGKVVHFIPRQGIEGHSAQEIAENLKQAFAQYC